MLQSKDQGHTLRYRIDVARAAYDGARIALVEKAKADIQHVISNVATEKYQQTNLMGTLELAAEEFPNESAGARKVLIILSDVIQDDRNYNFKTESKLGSEARARDFAAELVRSRPLSLANMKAYIGLVQSVDLQKLSKTRR